MLKTTTQKKSFLNPGVNSFFKGKYLLVLIMFVFSTHNSSAQILIAGTSFDPIDPVAAASKTYIGITEVAQYGFQTGALTVTPAIAPNVNANIFNASYYYAIANNPFKLDNTRYSNWATPDYAFVFAPRKPTGANINVLQYSVTNLSPGTAVSATVWYCSAVSATYIAAPDNCNGQRNEFKAGINLDQFNQLNGTDATQIGMGECQSKVYTGTVDASGNAVFRINATRDGVCEAMALTKIEITGIPAPKIVSMDGAEVCAGEQVSLTTVQSYNATYQWQVSTNGGGSWSNIAGATTKSALYEATAVGSYQFRLNITPSNPVSATITTTPITVSAITCCTEGGFPASRQTIYYDNFGRIDLTDKTGHKYFVWDYSDPLNPVEVAKTTTDAFRWPLVPAPLGATYVGTPGPLIDGQYTVAGYLTGYNPDNGYAGAHLEWANRVTGPTVIPDLSYDHSGAVDGAALFLNCPPNTLGQVLYSRDISNLCFGKQLFFECWIAVFTTDATGPYNGVNVQVKLTDGGNAANVITATGTANRAASGGGVWVKIATQINLVGTTLKMEIINNQNVSVDGNDLVLDDIKIMACAPPPLDLYFDLPTLSQNDVICNDATEPLYVKPSALLKNYYGGTPLYLYQWTRTPTVATSWTNLAVPATSSELYTINSPMTSPPFSGLSPGGLVYFRVVAASAAIFTANNNFVSPKYANINDPCKNYSVSTAIPATVTCPLPVTLVSFTGTNQGDLNLLSWLTSSEKNNSHFVIERSTNGTDFTEIGRVAGKGNTNSMQIYSFQDMDASEGINYYRLQQVDLDGNFAYSKTIAVKDGESEHFDLAIYPNPNDGSFNILMKNQTQSYKLDIADVQGKSVYTQSGTEVPSTIQVSNLSDGVYILRIHVGNEVITKKLIVY
jgi:hypothetical protein